MSAFPTDTPVRKYKQLSPLAGWQASSAKCMGAICSCLGGRSQDDSQDPDSFVNERTGLLQSSTDIENDLRGGPLGRGVNGNSMEPAEDEQRSKDREAQMQKIVSSTAENLIHIFNVNGAERPAVQTNSSDKFKQVVARIKPSESMEELTLSEADKALVNSIKRKEKSVMKDVGPLMVFLHEDQPNIKN